MLPAICKCSVTGPTFNFTLYIRSLNAGVNYMERNFHKDNLICDTLHDSFPLEHHRCISPFVFNIRVYLKGAGGLAFDAFSEENLDILPMYTEHIHVFQSSKTIIDLI